MICEICKQNRIKKVIEQSKQAMRRFTEKLKKEKYESSKQTEGK